MTAVTEWLQREIIDRGRLPLLFFLLGFLLAFLFIRFSVRMIRAQVRWWPGNVTPGGHHVHHVVFGVVTMVIAGGSLIAVYEDGTQTTGAALATLFGIGTALVLDEFALIFYLNDVYWEQEGRVSVDAVFVAIAVTGLVLLGLQPLEFADITNFREDPSWVTRTLIALSAVGNLALAAVVLAKGKIWTGLVGLFVFPPAAGRGGAPVAARRTLGPLALHRQDPQDAPRDRTRAALPTPGDPGEDLRAGPRGRQADDGHRAGSRPALPRRRRSRTGPHRARRTPADFRHPGTVWHN